MLKKYNSSNLDFWKFGFAVLCGILLTIPNLKGEITLTDPFHHGEFIAASVNLLSERTLNFTPLTIHGALDYIPAIIARHIWGESNYFLPTLAIYNSLTILANLILLLIASDITQNHNHRWQMLLATALAAPVLVGFRDLFLLISFYTFLKIQKISRNTLSKILLLAILGGSVSFGVFWSFDRGLACLTSLGIAIFILIPKKHIYLISLTCFTLLFLFLTENFHSFSLINYYENIKALMQTSSQWSYEWNYETFSKAVFVTTATLLTMALLIRNIRNSSWSIEKIATGAALLVLAIFMLKIGINRADSQHTYYSLWAPMLSAFFVYKSEEIYPQIVKYTSVAALVMACTIAFRSTNFLVTSAIFLTVIPRSTKHRIPTTSTILIIALIFSGSSLLYTTAKSIVKNEFYWLNTLSSPPSNFSASTPGIQWASAQLLQANAHCVFDLSNNGTINGLTNLPTCSRFVYPVYAGPMHQNELIDSLQESSPNAIVYSTTYWSYAIDGKSMKNRFPTLDQFIVSNYPEERCSTGYCIRYKRNTDEKQSQ